MLFHKLTDQLLKINRFHLLAGHGLLDRRQLYYGGEDGCHSPVAAESLIVKDQVLKLPLLYGHQHSPVNGIHRRNDAAFPRLQPDALLRAAADADAAAQANARVDPGEFANAWLWAGGCTVHIGNRNRLDGADLCAFSPHCTRLCS